MTRLTDELIRQLANANAPHAYSYEVKAMAREILERREAVKLTSYTPTPNPLTYNPTPLAKSANPYDPTAPAGQCP